MTSRETDVWRADIAKLDGTVVYDDGDTETVVLGSLIGRGVYGNVYNGMSGKTPVAVKIQQKTDDALVELALYRRLWRDNADVPYICRAIGAQLLTVGCDTYAVLVMEKYAGTLHDMSARLDNDDVFDVLRQMTVALEYLHRPFVRRDGRLCYNVHRDIHANNIFLTSCLTARLGDFGWCGVYTEMAPGTRVTANRLAGDESKPSRATMRGRHREYGSSRRSDVLMAVGAVLCSFKGPGASNGVSLWGKLFERRVETHVFDVARKPAAWTAPYVRGCDERVGRILTALFEGCDCLSSGAMVYACVQDVIGAIV